MTASIPSGLRQAAVVAVAAALAFSCGGPPPSRAPLSSSARAIAERRPSSSRTPDESDESEARDEVEITITPSDDDDDSPDCTALAPASSCLGASLARRTCETLGHSVEPQVGKEWLTCMRDASTGSICDSHRIIECGLRAVGGARVDGSNHALCGEIASSCMDIADEITAPVCEHLLAAWRPERRSQLTDCLRHGCETGAFGSCLP